MASFTAFDNFHQILLDYYVDFQEYLAHTNYTILITFILITIVILLTIYLIFKYSFTNQDDLASFNEAIAKQGDNFKELIGGGNSKQQQAKHNKKKLQHKQQQQQPQNKRSTAENGNKKIKRPLILKKQQQKDDKFAAPDIANLPLVNGHGNEDDKGEIVGRQDSIANEKLQQQDVEQLADAAVGHNDDEVADKEETTKVTAKHVEIDENQIDIVLITSEETDGGGTEYLQKPPPPSTNKRRDSVKSILKEQHQQKPEVVDMITTATATITNHFQIIQPKDDYQLQKEKIGHQGSEGGFEQDQMAIPGGQQPEIIATATITTENGNNNSNDQQQQELTTTISDNNANVTMVATSSKPKSKKKSAVANANASPTGKIKQLIRTTDLTQHDRTLLIELLLGNNEEFDGDEQLSITSGGGGYGSSNNDNNWIQPNSNNNNNINLQLQQTVEQLNGEKLITQQLSTKLKDLRNEMVLEKNKLLKLKKDYDDELVKKIGMERMELQQRFKREQATTLTQLQNDHLNQLKTATTNLESKLQSIVQEKEAIRLQSQHLESQLQAAFNSNQELTMNLNQLTEHCRLLEETNQNALGQLERSWGNRLKEMEEYWRNEMERIRREVKEEEGRKWREEVEKRGQDTTQKEKNLLNLLDDQSHQLTQQKQTLQQHQDELQELNKQLSLKQQQLQNLELLNTELTNKSEGLQQKLTTTEKEVTIAKELNEKDREQAKNELNKLNDEMVVTLTAELNELKNQLIAFNTEKESHEERTGKLNDKCTELRNANQILISNLQITENKLVELHTNWNELVDGINSLLVEEDSSLELPKQASTDESAANLTSKVILQKLNTLQELNKTKSNEETDKYKQIFKNTEQLLQNLQQSLELTELNWKQELLKKDEELLKLRNELALKHSKGTENGFNNNSVKTMAEDGSAGNESPRIEKDKSFPATPTTITSNISPTNAATNSSPSSPTTTTGTTPPAIAPVVEKKKKKLMKLFK